jgi:hypothetical protein
MVKNKKPLNATAELVNFHFSTSLSAVSQQQQQRSGSGNGNNRRNRSDPQQSQNHQQQSQQRRRQYQRNKEDRASARKKASGKMFFLHSSPDHAFVISRRSYHHGCAEQHQQAQAASSSYSFLGSDEAVSWEVVRSVKYFASASQQREACPICLDTFTVCLVSFLLMFLASFAWAQTPWSHISSFFLSLPCVLFGVVRTNYKMWTRVLFNVLVASRSVQRHESTIRQWPQMSSTCYI